MRTSSEQRSAISSGEQPERDEVAELLLREVARAFGSTPEAIKGRSRIMEHHLPRQIFVRLAVNDLKRHPDTVALYVQRERTASIQMMRALQNRLDTEPRLAERVERLRTDLRDRGFFL